MTKVIAAALFLALQYYVYNHFASVEVHPPRASFAGFPLELGGWHCDQRQPMEARVIANLGVTDYLMCSYHNALAPAAPVGVYVGYHASQVNTAGGKENRIHPPAHCLPGSGWDIMASEDRVVDLPGLPGGPANVKRLVIAKGDQRQLVYYWYQERGRVIADDWRKFIDLFWDRARMNRTDGALVRFTVPMGRDEAQADEALRGLATALVPLLPAYVPN